MLHIKSPAYTGLRGLLREQSTVRSVNISFDRHPTSQEELLSFAELRNYESSNSSRKTASEFIDECVIPAVPGGYY